ncbi:hypothetical protein B0T18DRAFT_395147 [Schizothecium vesticola]|uniref:Uncharacterized protein n=1 Tax=Schizothecium vesticola TaxID=314040 RepID=A0AA40BR72_9PEZI|nr:hypothetical protein B0T18DRAFT_395147 [Schizothecium vesticola]
MKFFATAAVMALAAGSAVAHTIPRPTIPEFKALSGAGAGLPADFSGYTKAVEIPEVEKPEVEIPEVEKPEIEIPEVTRRDDEVEVEVGDIEGEVSGVGVPLAEVSEVVKVTQDVTIIVQDVKVLVAENLALIRETVVVPDVDVDSLLSLIEQLKSNIEILLKDVVSKLVALVFKTASLEDADLEKVSELLADITSIVTDVESTLQALVESDLKLDILAVVLAPVQAILSLLSAIITSVVPFALALVSGLDVNATVSRITSTVGDLNDVLSLVGTVLAPLLTGLGL